MIFMANIECGERKLNNLIKMTILINASNINEAKIAVRNHVISQHKKAFNDEAPDVIKFKKLIPVLANDGDYISAMVDDDELYIYENFIFE